MFRALGEFVTRRWKLVLVAWVFVTLIAAGIQSGFINRLGVLPWQLPVWEDVVKDGEFGFLPRNMPSLQGERLFAEAFPKDMLTSSVVIVVRHESAELDDQDDDFIENHLAEGLRQLKNESGSVIAEVRTSKDPLIGKLLISQDHKAALVIVELTTEFLEHHNRTTINKIEQLIDPHGELRDHIPPGVHLAMSGSATVGRDMIAAAADSARDTEKWTILLVVGLLLLIYRAPVLALIPLITVAVAVHISITLLVLLSRVPGLGLEPFEGLKIYITVVAYGAGVDYCLFLIARYKEELDRGATLEAALSHTIHKVGAALTASAMTVACGIGMMVFAEFGKFRQAGIGMSLSLFVMLIASLTFTPALLRMAGPFALRLTRGSERPLAAGGWISGTRFVSRWLDQYSFQRFWEWMGRLLERRPGTVWLACMCVMIPFAVIGAYFQDYLSYGLLTELPQTKQSVLGAKAVQEHFPAGNTAPVTVLLKNPKVDFLDPTTGLEALDALVEKLREQKDKLGIADIRSVVDPMGWEHQVNPFKRGAARLYYVSQTEQFKGKVARLDLVFDNDPFSRDAIRRLDDLQKAIHESLPPEVAGSEVHLMGTTASMRDLKHVTDRDQVVIDMLVLIVVYLILVALLRKLAIPAYLILSVYFSYFVALGFTFTVFYLLDPAGFSGLDWKVPMFLFTILIAVGEDYNIFLMTRIDEEQAEYGAVGGVRVALLQTGSIISSCGVIMAGTFFSLVLAGSLVGMQQLGFALAFGVLLDTFVVRPILVPAYLIMLHSGRFGLIGEFLGSAEPDTRNKTE
jgi:RND superfamily putative drug exporter